MAPTRAVEKVLLVFRQVTTSNRFTSANVKMSTCGFGGCRDVLKV